MTDKFFRLIFSFGLSAILSLFVFASSALADDAAKKAAQGTITGQIEAFKAGDFLVFGRETRGLPEAMLHAHQESLLTIPMQGTRSLNLATAVAIVLFEAMRQNAEAG